MNTNFIKNLLQSTQSTGCHEKEVTLALWSGYGQISRYQLDGAKIDTVEVKHIVLDHPIGHPRGWSGDNSHNRKVRSYEVETHWYE